MRYTSIRQLITLMVLAFAATSIYAQQRFTYYTPVGGGAPHGGIFKDVQGTTDAAGNDVISAVGSDDIVPANGLLAYHNGACIPTTYTTLTNPTAPGGHPVDAKAICDFGNNRVVGCFYDPVDKASDIVFADLAGNVIWQTRIKNFHVKDVDTYVSPNAGKIWLTGYSTDAGLARAVVAVGLNALLAGQQIFHIKYVLGPNVVNSEGFEIDHNPGTGNLTVLGRLSVNACTSGAFTIRLNSNTGAWMNGRYYYDAACNYDLVGKALVVTPGFFNDYSLVMDYHDIATGNTYPAYMQIVPALTIVPLTPFYSNAFASNQMHVDGVDADGTDLLASGVYDVGAGPRGMTWSVDPTIPATIQFNEYTNLGAYTPVLDQLVDLDFYPNTGLYYIGGNFVNNPAGGGAAWPIANNNAFWLIGANANGNSDCNDYDANVDVPIAPTTVLMNVQTIKDTTTTCPLTSQVVSPFSFDQCVAKRHGTGVIPAELAPAGLQFAYLEGQGQILATIPAEATGQVTLTLVDLQGRILQRYTLTAGTHHLDATQLSSGVYFLQYQGQNLPAGVHKIAVR